MRARPIWRGLARSERGTALLEFGMAVPILALVILGTVDFARAVAFQQNLEEIANRALERATAMGNATDSYATVRLDAIAAAAVPAADVTLDRWQECDGVRQASYDVVCPAAQQLARFMSIEIRKTYAPLFNMGVLEAAYGQTGMSDGIPMKGDAMVRVQ